MAGYVCVPVSCKEFWRTLWAFRSTLVLILTPILLCPLPVLVPDPAALCAYAILIMAVYWITEVIPLAVTALLPMVLFPTLGVLDMKTVCANYLKDTNMLFVGGLIVATAVEKWNLHKRIALRVLLSVGSRPVWLMFGFMTTTAFLSMWMSNTATTAMMIPIAHAVLVELLDKKRQYRRLSMRNSGRFQRKGDNGVYVDGQLEQRDVETQADLDEIELGDAIDGEVKPEKEEETKAASLIDLTDKSMPPEDRSLSKGVTLCVAYAANIGGTATLTGTGPNLVISGQVETLYGTDAVIDFGSWFIYAFPGMLVCLFLAWVWLQLQYLDLWSSIKRWFRLCCSGRCSQCCRENCLCLCCKDKEKSKRVDPVESVIRKQYEALGPMSWAEGAVLCHFIILALLWLTRDPKFAPGWVIAFRKGYVTDSTAGVFISVLLFCFPAYPPNFGCLKARNDHSIPRPKEALLDWHTVNTKLPWNVVILLGGGFALAEACKESGLSAWLGDRFVGLAVIPPVAMVIVITVIIALFTEITSNTSTASIFLPILGQLGTSLGIHPFYFMIPATVACSFAFMLPVATPPNAIVFAYGTLSILDMAKCGFFMNILCLIVVNISINTIGVALFDLHTFPSWAAEGSAATTAAMTTPINCSEYLLHLNGTASPFNVMTTL
ncbi:Na(+)/citrate cotransporter-like [Ptychodera flava]|uniref:Na(+)/citrate cotransporter-like n=1 Tax=Ptychodera flava TaxID=63121 RepID=UPI00396A2EBC